MKVNMNQIPDKKPVSKKPKSNKASTQGTGGNVYKESFNMYMDKWKEQLQGGKIFRNNKFWIVLAVILFLVLLSVNSNLNNKKTQLTLDLRHTTAETEALKNAIAEVKANLEEQARIDALKLTEEEEELAKNNAIEQGVQVATLQNAYRYLDVTDDYEAFTKNKNALDACFGNDDKNARTPWYPSVNSISGSWEFASKASFYGDTAKVLWLCYADDDHTLLAYCTARYHADTKLFTDVTWKLTSYAAANIKSDDGTGGPMEQITSIEDALKELAESGELDLLESDEELDEDTLDARSSYKDAVSNGNIEGEEFDERYHFGIGNPK